MVDCKHLKLNFSVMPIKHMRSNFGNKTMYMYRSVLNEHTKIDIAVFTRNYILDVGTFLAYKQRQSNAA